MFSRIRQADMAFRELIRDRDSGGLSRFSDALIREGKARREYAATISEKREILLEAMFRRYPAVAQRILAGIQTGRPPRPRRRSTAR
jgi:hypothetical protein